MTKNDVDGSKYFYKNGSFMSLVEWLAWDAPVRLNWPVQEIRWAEGVGAEIMGPRNEVCFYSCHIFQLCAHLKVQCRAGSLKRYRNIPFKLQAVFCTSFEIRAQHDR